MKITSNNSFSSAPSVNNTTTINTDSIAILAVSLFVGGVFSLGIYHNFPLIQNVFVPKLKEEINDEDINVMQTIRPSLNRPNNKEILKSELMKNKPLEEKYLLEYVSYDELVKIRSSYDHSKLETLVEFIQLGKWEELIHFYKNETSSPIHTILKAAYFQGKITIDELATAYIFLAPAVSNQSYTIHKIEELFSGNNEWGDVTNRWSNIVGIPENLRFFISVDISSMSPKAVEFTKSAFDNINGRRFKFEVHWMI